MLYFRRMWNYLLLSDEDWLDLILHQDTLLFITLSHYLSRMMICSKICIQKYTSHH